MDVSGFLALLHQLFPSVSVIVIIGVALIVLLLTLILQARKGEGQRIKATLSVSTGPTSSPLSSSDTPSQDKNHIALVPPITVTAEANPTISPMIQLHVNLPSVSQSPSLAPEASNSVSPAIPIVDDSVDPAASLQQQEDTDNSPIGYPSAAESPAVHVDVNKGIERPSTGVLAIPHTEMHMRGPSTVSDSPHLAPADSPVSDVASHSNSIVEAELGEIDTATLHGMALVAPPNADEVSALVMRASPSGRLTVQRSDAQTALRMVSFIAQRTYAFTRASQRVSQAQRPFAGELRSLRLLSNYTNYVRPRLLRLNRSLNRLGIGWNEQDDDPRWVVFAFTDPFSISLVERTPAAMREAMNNTAQKVAAAIEAEGYTVERERKWGPNGAMFYSLYDRGSASTSLDDADWTDSDIEEADAELDDDGDEIEV